MRLKTVILAAVLMATHWTTAQTPVPVAERLTTHLGRTTRVSLFSNHVVVVSINSDTEDFIHQATLDFDEYMVYLQALNQAAAEIGAEPIGSHVESRESMTSLVLHVGPNAPMLFRYSPLSSLSLPVSSISSVMDDLQNRALAALPGEFEIKQWNPEIGDCVELRQGGSACVSVVSEDGSIVLRREDIAMTYTVSKENRADVVLKIIERTP